MTAISSLDAAPATFRRLDPRVVGLWRMSTGFSTLVWAGVAIGIFVFVGVPRPLWSIVVLVLLAGAISAFAIAPRRYRMWEFQVGAANVRVRHGVLWRTDSVVPHARIQHVDTTQGPIERWMGLASVVIFTAGSVGGSITIPGLAHGEADALRDQLAALSGADDAV